jgi:hypothetical protein
MRKKHAVMIFGGIVGLSGAVADGLWPNHAAPIQMALYSALTLGLLCAGLWSDRDRSRFWAGMSFVFLLHCLVLYFIRSYFPFGTILAIIPTAALEDIVLYIFMLKTLGY